LYWTLSQDERALLANKTGATRLAFALLLKLFQRDGRFPERREEIAGNIVTYLAQQLGVSPDVYLAVDWSERTQRQHRAQIREHCGFRVFGAQDEAEFVTWLRARVTTPNPEAETLKLAAYGHLRAQHLGHRNRLACVGCSMMRCDTARTSWSQTPSHCVPPRRVQHSMRSSRRAHPMRTTAVLSKPPFFPSALNLLRSKRTRAR